MEIKGKNYLVVGLGVTGIATAEFLLKNGARVTATDQRTREELPENVAELESRGVKIVAGCHDINSVLSSTEVVLSPGVPFSSPVVKAAEEAGRPVISEVELAGRYIKTPIIAITGSNGKTTTATLIAQILTNCGKKVFLGGNIGTPLITIAGKDKELDFIVAELSSFQLQGTKSFSPYISVLLNISPNHLDHHSDFGEYLSSKLMLTRNQGESDFVIYKESDELIAKGVESSKAAKVPFGFREESSGNENGVYCDGNKVRFRGEEISLEGMQLRGSHNKENAMAAIAAARIAGCPMSLIEQTTVGFAPLEHRIELIREIKGVKFYNDSKSTSPAATLKALESFEAPVILIAGGKDKGTSYGVLSEEIKKKVKLLILMGESSEKMREQLGMLTDTVLAADLDDTVSMAIKETTLGDTVLFSPGCSSFDMFESFEDRGRRFKSIVKNIPN